ncbi:leucine-rich repeat domain-containing protein [Lentzea sp. NPDC051213]|uniref:leucine-rich repeat domain-containing protein n=1 Tax=Lentzea sp. NPDC051213 TaxID=3364126 RepID=UPI0037915E5F
MGENTDTPKTFPNRFADSYGQSSDRCECFKQQRRKVRFHAERQDPSAPGWLHLLDLVEEAAADGRTVFKPLLDLSPSERREVVTLPPTIAKLTAVEHLDLYGSNLVRIPPAIGAMVSLRRFDPYTSYRLHWFPYELTRCTRFNNSTVSTRAIYGNFKFRPPFPALRPPTTDLTDLDPGIWGTESVHTCSVCDGPITELNHRWITLLVGSDHLPLLVNACSTDCVAALPTPPDDYVPTPHTGGPDLVQPA